MNIVSSAFCKFLAKVKSASYNGFASSYKSRSILYCGRHTPLLIFYLNSLNRKRKNNRNTAPSQPLLHTLARPHIFGNSWRKLETHLPQELQRYSSFHNVKRQAYSDVNGVTLMLESAVPENICAEGLHCSPDIIALSVFKPSGPLCCPSSQP